MPHNRNAKARRSGASHNTSKRNAANRRMLTDLGILLITGVVAFGLGYSLVVALRPDNIPTGSTNTDGPKRPAGSAPTNVQPGGPTTENWAPGNDGKAEDPASPKAPANFKRVSRLRALTHPNAKPDFTQRMEVVEVRYLGFDSVVHWGQIVVDGEIASEVRDIFEEIFIRGGQIEKIIPISEFSWSDENSIRNNNTSAYNYRTVIKPGAKSTQLSKHAYGRAIDVNPYQNPYVVPGRMSRAYDPLTLGTLTADSVIVKVFKEHGWDWGGDWPNGKDYQHFERP